MFDFSVRFDAIDKISRVVDSINQKLAKVDAQAKRTSDTIRSRLGSTFTFKLDTAAAMKKIEDLKQKMDGVRERGGARIEAGKKRFRAGRDTAMSGIAVAAIPIVAINAARQYELAFKDVKKSVSGTDEEIGALYKKMKDFSGASFEDLSVVVAQAGKLGVSANDVMDFSTSVIKGAKALDFEAEDAVQKVGKILAMTNQMNNAVEASNEVMDKAANLENKVAGAKAAGTLDIWMRSADRFNDVKFDNTQMAGMSAFLNQNFVQSELGASGFNMMINKFKSMESELGFIEKIKTGGLQGIKDVMAEINKMTPEQQLKKFGSEAMQLIDKLKTKEGMAKLEFAFEMSKDSLGAVDKEWVIFRETFDERLNDFKKSWSNTMDSLGKPLMKVAGKLMPMIGGVLDGISNFAQKHQTLAGAIMVAVIAIGLIVVALGVLGMVVGAVQVGIGAMATMSVVLTGKYGLLTAAQWLLNAAFWANPLTWVVMAIIALIAVVVLLIVYWDEVVAYVRMLWAEFMQLSWVQAMWQAVGAVIGGIIQMIVGYFRMWFAAFSMLFGWIKRVWAQMGGFQGAIAAVAGAVNLVGAAFSAIIAPIQAAIGWIDSFLSKFEIYNKAKAAVTGWFGGGDAGGGVAGANASPFRGSVDVNVTASGGAKASATSRSRGVNLSNVSNGVGR